MKREGYLYNKIISKSNIELAITRSSRGKTKRKDVKRVLNNIDYYVEKIYKLLSTKSYVPSEYKISIIMIILIKKRE